ncbi:efflux RND transporter permease subunit [Biformimicrobium ophioploci]|uniref:Efflux pump membrane transporter n=1 Tax=Biformimicrobium ophioploci TaxID=3036711 RepID=A0ABQ6M247_9GAMM|nr:multidrug efflux RND transporter permease subunit [Microbulbifer sp. NKW57]GMG88340.1 efflux RND transporter permease subunit VmeQ [Microbulbifer sp. NKW57]
MSPEFFIKRPKFAFVISILITIIGLLSLFVMPVDQYPDIASPKINVRAVYPGADAQTVKDAIATPIEDQVNGAEGMVYMTSKSSSDGSYNLTVTFDIGVDDDMAQVDVQNRVALAEPLLPPEVVKRGIKVRKRSSDMLMVVNLLSPDDRYDGIFLSNYASLNVKNELARVAGVGEARVIGALDYGMRVWLDPIKMAKREISVNQVIAAIKEQNVQAAVGQLGGQPAPEDTQFQYVLRTKGRLVTEEEFGDIVLRAGEGGAVIRMRDVARIELGAFSYRGFGEYNNRPGVVLAIYKLSDANALNVAEAVKEKMQELSQYFPEGLEYDIGHDTTEFISASLEETVHTLFFTIALVVFVTYLFLGNARAALIPTIAVPVSIIGTLAVLYALGMTVNTVTLFALILAIGVVVDDAIIVVENVERIMEEEGLSPREATSKAMKEVAGPIFATSMVLAAVFGPTMLLPGMTGRMFGQFGTTLVVSVLISMVNALTLSPALASIILKPGHHKPNLVIRGFNAVFNRVASGYVSLVDWMARHLVISFAIIVALFAALVFLFKMTPASFIPDEDKGFFMVDVTLPEAASLNRTEKVMDEIADALKADPAIDKVISVNGVGLISGAILPNAGMVIAKLKHWHERKSPETHQFALQKKYQAQFAQMPEAQMLVFGAPAIPGLGAMAGFSFMLEDTQGRGAQSLAEVVELFSAEASRQPEITRAFSTFRASSPQIQLNIDRVKAKTLGVSISDIFLALQTHLGALYVNDFNLYNKTFKVMVQADSRFRQDEDDLNSIYVTNAKGEQVPISAVLTTEASRGSDILDRHNTYDAAMIRGGPNMAGGYSSGDAMAALERVAGTTLPEGYKYEWSNSSFEERKAGNAAVIALFLSLIFTYLFLAALYESFLTPFAIILSVPIAIVGALIALQVGVEPLSLYGQIGLVLLIGLASKTAILIVEFGKSQREVQKQSLHDATVTAAKLRFRPVVMTSISFVVGVLPLVIASGAGAASRVSLGLAVFGGTIMACIAGTLLVPIFFKMVQALREKVHGGPTPAPE